MRLQMEETVSVSFAKSRLSDCIKQLQETREIITMVEEDLEWMKSRGCVFNYVHSREIENIKQQLKKLREFESTYIGRLSEISGGL